MSDMILATILSGSTLLNIAILGFVIRLSAQVSKMNGKVERHDKALKACPFCTDKEG